jgi:CBS domain-containing protein
MLARDIMKSPVVSVLPGATVMEAIALMLEGKLSGLPVVTADQKLVGIVSEGDFLRRFELGTEGQRPRWIEFLRGPGRAAEEFVRTHGRKVEEVMSVEVVTADASAALSEVVALMERHRVKRVPIVEAGKIVGIITRADLLRALAERPAALQVGSTDDASIRQAILSACEQQAWAPRALIAIDVKDGIVALSGTIFDERERQGLKVIIENVPGVRGVRDHLVWVEPISGNVLEAPKDSDALKENSDHS